MPKVKAALTEPPTCEVFAESLKRWDKRRIGIPGNDKPHGPEREGEPVRLSVLVRMGEAQQDRVRRIEVGRREPRRVLTDPPENLPVSLLTFLTLHIKVNASEVMMTQKLKSFQVMLKGYECEQCAHRWVPRVKDERPAVCPKCKSYRWDKKGKRA